VIYLVVKKLIFDEIKEALKMTLILTALISRKNNILRPRDILVSQ
jgi:hypothetical protein